MPTVRFTGRVLPAARNFCIACRPTFSWKADDLGLEMTFRVNIQDGNVRIECEVNRFDKTAHFMPLFLRAYDIVTACVDLAAFANGEVLTVVLESFTDPTGASIPIATRRPSLAALVTAARPDTRDFEKILRIVLAEPALFMALRDLIEALSSPQRAAVICARAIGNLGPFFRPSDGPSETGWLALRDKLQISKTYLQRITHPSVDGPVRDREGGTADVTHRAWIVMNRFLEYLKRDGQPLPLSEFPLLT